MNYVDGHFQTKPKLSENEAKQQEEEELQLAMAISLSEEESKASVVLSFISSTGLCIFLLTADPKVTSEQLK